jgi:hypothetical protein
VKLATIHDSDFVQQNAANTKTNKQQFVPTNHNGKSKTNKSRHYMKKPQKLESDQFYKGMYLWMQSMIKWMDHQMKACQQPPPGRQEWVRKDEGIHPLRGRGSGLT